MQELSMHALLITGAARQKRQDIIDQKLVEWHVTAHDTVILELAPDAASIGIQQVREFQKRLTLTPYESPYTAGIIHDMHTLTVEAQNSLLKTLEEPPPHAKIIGVAPSDGILLPTVLSRMQHIALQTEPITQEATRVAFALFQELSGLSAGAKLARIEPLTSTKETAAAWIDSTIPAWEAKLHEKQDAATTAALARAIRLLLTASRRLTANVNYRLTIDNAILEL